MLKRKSVVMKREIKRFSLSSDEEDIFGSPIIKNSKVKTKKERIKRDVIWSSDEEDIFEEKNVKNVLSDSSDEEEFHFRPRRISIPSDEDIFGENIQGRKSDEVKRGIKKRFPASSQDIFGTGSSDEEGKPKKVKMNIDVIFARFCNPFRALKWLDCPYSPYWQILGNSSRNFSEMPVFWVMLLCNR